MDSNSDQPQSPPQRGRVPLPPDQRLSEWIHVRVTPQDRRAIEQAAGHDGVATWARGVMTAAARDVEVVIDQKKGNDSHVIRQ